MYVFVSANNSISSRGDYSRAASISFRACSGAATIRERRLFKRGVYPRHAQNWAKSVQKGGGLILYHGHILRGLCSTQPWNLCNLAILRLCMPFRPEDIMLQKLPIILFFYSHET